MTDREMLELAAKAAGIELEGWYESADAFNAPHHGWWNPRTDDGDAFGLLVILIREHGYELQSHNDAACLQSDRYDYIVEVPWNDDPDGALREAVVRAAAVIGRSME